MGKGGKVRRGMDRAIGRKRTREGGNREVITKRREEKDKNEVRRGKIGRKLGEKRG